MFEQTITDKKTCPLCKENMYIDIESESHYLEGRSSTIEFIARCNSCLYDFRFPLLEYSPYFIYFFSALAWILISYLFGFPLFLAILGFGLPITFVLIVLFIVYRHPIINSYYNKRIVRKAKKMVRKKMYTNTWTGDKVVDHKRLEERLKNL